MATVQITLDEDLAGFLEEGDRPLSEVARERLVLDLFRRAQISRGRAARLLGMDLLAFLRLASRAGIPVIDMTPDEWQAEVARIRSR